MQVGHVAAVRGARGVRVVARQMRRRWLAFWAVSLTLSWTVSAQAAFYVNGAAVGANTGASWTDAYTDLQSALADANCSEVWVAHSRRR